MKKSSLGVIFAFVAVLSAQAQSNTLLVYGSASYDSQNGSGGNSYTFSPGVGYQWNENWTGGVNLSFMGSNYTYKTSGISAGPFIRYTQPLAGVFVIYGQFNANFLSGKTSPNPAIGSGRLSYNGFEGTFFPAIGVDLKNGFALNFGFGSLSFASRKFSTATSAINNFQVNFGTGASFGISKNFGLKK